MGKKPFPGMPNGKVELLFNYTEVTSSRDAKILFGPQCGPFVAFTDSTRKESSGWTGGFFKDPCYHGSPLSYLFEVFV